MAKNEKTTKKVGRPSSFTQEMADKICHAVSTSSMGLHRLCKLNPDFPSHDAIYQWRAKYPEFADQYAQAKRKQIDVLIEEILDISDDNSNDIKIDANGNPVPNGEHMMRSRLRIDTRKWLASKLVPKIYGDRLQNDTNVTVIKHEDALKSFL